MREIKTFTDYHSFGMWYAEPAEVPMPPSAHYTSFRGSGTGQYSADDYRYGFQGQEKDDEIKGPGNSINYKYRMHDPRLGRFFAVDPLAKKNPFYSPYAFSGNKVIHAVELEGLEEDIVIRKQFSSQIRTAIEVLTEKETEAYNTREQMDKNVQDTKDLQDVKAMWDILSLIPTEKWLEVAITTTGIMYVPDDQVIDEEIQIWEQYKEDYQSIYNSYRNERLTLMKELEMLENSTISVQEDGTIELETSKPEYKSGYGMELEVNARRKLESMVNQYNDEISKPAQRKEQPAPSTH